MTNAFRVIPCVCRGRSDHLRACVSCVIGWNFVRNNNFRTPRSHSVKVELQRIRIRISKDNYSEANAIPNSPEFECEYQNHKETSAKLYTNDFLFFKIC